MSRTDIIWYERPRLRSLWRPVLLPQVFNFHNSYPNALLKLLSKIFFSILFTSYQLTWSPFPESLTIKDHRIFLLGAYWKSIVKLKLSGNIVRFLSHFQPSRLFRSGWRTISQPVLLWASTFLFPVMSFGRTCVYPGKWGGCTNVRTVKWANLTV